MDEQQTGSMKCEKCGAEFESQALLDEHMRSAHPEGTESGSEGGTESTDGMESGGQMTP